MNNQYMLYIYFRGKGLYGTKELICVYIHNSINRTAVYIHVQYIYTNDNQLLGGMNCCMILH